MRPSFLDYLRQQAALPESQRDPPPPDETPEEREAKRADLERRLDADIAETEARIPRCHICGLAASCFGSYESETPVYSCDRCCGHGNEDGWCKPLSEGGIIDIPQCMLDAAGLEEMDR